MFYPHPRSLEARYVEFSKAWKPPHLAIVIIDPTDEFSGSEANSCIIVRLETGDIVYKGCQKLVVLLKQPDLLE